MSPLVLSSDHLISPHLACEEPYTYPTYNYEHQPRNPQRRLKKRDFRSLWIVRIGAAARVNGLNYSQFMHGLSLAGIELDRKVLADLAANSPEAFAELAGQARSAIENKPQAAA